MRQFAQKIASAISHALRETKTMTNGHKIIDHDGAGIVGVVVNGRELTPSELAEAKAKGRVWFQARFGSKSLRDYPSAQTIPAEDDAA